MKDIGNIKKILIAFVKRYHLVVFVVTVVLLLSVAVLLLNTIVSKASGEDAVAPNGASSNFDQATIDRIKELKTSNQPSEPLDLSKGRINPFNE